MLLIVIMVCVWIIRKMLAQGVLAQLVVANVGHLASFVLAGVRFDPLLS
jgi:hypothetical protein